MIITPLPKMAIKATGCDAKDAIRKNESVFLVRIYGEATDAKTKESRNGDAYTYLVGSFRAERPAKDNKEREVNGDTVIYQSEVLFLPAGVQERIESELKTSGGKPVKFGYDIFSQPDSSVSTGYRYAAAAIIETASADRLAVMAGELANKPLPGMKKAEPAPAQSEAAKPKKK